jgi:hypothetical protein
MEKIPYETLTRKGSESVFEGVFERRKISSKVEYRL